MDYDGHGRPCLGVSPRTVRRFIERGDLEGRKLKDGIVEAWEVSIDSLQTLRDRRGPEGRVREYDRRETVQGHSSPDTSPDMADLVRDLTADLIRTSSEATEYRVRLELTEHAQSTLEEQLTAERASREQAERERDELRRQLEALEPASDEPHAPETATEEPEGTERPHPTGCKRRQAYSAGRGGVGGSGSSSGPSLN